MTGGARPGWRGDPYRRHELRYWDGLTWTACVSDMGVVGDDPVFPVPDDVGDYLAPRRRSPRVPGLDHAAAWAISGFLGVVALAAASSVDGLVASSSEPEVTSVEAAAMTALEALTALPSAPTGPEADSTVSGRPSPARPSWADRDGTGCDVRQRILRRDLTQVRLEADGCAVRSGVLRDPWSGVTIRYTRRPGERSSVAVDHVVSPAETWRTGAARLSADRRRALATDPLNLVAVSAWYRDGRADVGTWLPPKPSARCPYVAHRIAVKVRYDLGVTPTERAALRTVLRTCPTQPLPRPTTTALDRGPSGISAAQQRPQR